MPQDQFDKWLREQMNSSNPIPDLNNEWEGIRSRLDNKSRKRRFAMWWWLLPGVLAILAAVSLGIFTKETEIKEPLIEISESNVDQAIANSNESIQVTQKLTDIVAPAEQSLADTPVKTKISKSETTVVEHTADEILNQGLSSNSSQNTDSRLKPSVSSEIEKSPKVSIMSPQYRESIDIESLENSSSYVIKEPIDIHVASSNPHLVSGWHLDISTMIGISTLSNSNKSIADIESANEFYGLRLVAFKQLGGGISIGAGAAYQADHVVSEQKFIDTVSAQLHNALVRIRTDKNGGIENIYGTTSGQYVYHIDRTNHQWHHILSIPIFLKYESSLSKSWIGAAQIGFQPNLIRQYKGLGVMSNGDDLIIDEISDRYDSNVTVNVSAGISAYFSLSRSIMMGGGIMVSHQLDGTEVKNKTWEQKSTSIGIQIGLRKQL